MQHEISMRATRCSSSSRRERARSRPKGRRGLVLVVVLVMVALLALLAAAYAFLVQANLDTVMANHYRFQARMAAESGIQRVVALLRENRGAVDTWFNNPKELRGGLVEGLGSDDAYVARTDAYGYDPEAPAAWRFNLVAPNFDNPADVRYGVTDECARLDLNSATEQQLRTLISAVLPVNQDVETRVNVDILVDSMLDWREPAPTPRPNGAKDEYYLGLTPAYRCKKSVYSTVEELLLVRGFNGWILFGEDYNRNGLLDPNEDDGDGSFPPDNEDGQLFRGIAPYLTVWSRDWNLSSDGRQKINLNLRDTQKLRELLEAEFPGDIVNYVMQVRGSGVAFNSVMNLIPAPPRPEGDAAGESSSGGTGAPAQGESRRGGNETGASSSGGFNQGNSRGSSDPNGAPPRSENQGGSDGMANESGGGGAQGFAPPQTVTDGAPQVAAPMGGDEGAGNGDGSTGGAVGRNRRRNESGPQGTEGGPQRNEGGGRRGGGQGGRGRGAPSVYDNLTADPPPGGVEDLPLILDRLTTDPRPMMTGRVNVNTAPREVLMTLPALTPEDVDAMVAARAGLASEDKMTAAWLLTQGAIDEAKFRQILPRITTSASVFRAESVGYADHVGVVERLHVVFEMVGPIPQVLYYRNLGGLGAAYNPHGEETRGIQGQSGR